MFRFDKISARLRTSTNKKNDYNEDINDTSQYTSHYSSENGEMVSIYFLSF